MTLDLDGAPVRFVVDTGATDMVLSRQDAERIGITVDDLAFNGRANTANGTVSTARVWLDEVRLGDNVDRDVPAQVNGGEMTSSLLGMTYLQRYEVLNIANGRLTLVR